LRRSAVPDERDLVQRRDRRGLIHHGVIFFMLEKLGAVAGKDAGVLAWDSTDAAGAVPGVHSR
jgi:acyl-coenzyme A thioesterase PaaI-like protein